MFSGLPVLRSLRTTLRKSGRGSSSVGGRRSAPHTCRAGAGSPLTVLRSSYGAMILTRMTYEEMCAAHRWDVPPRYNIAADVCDKHPRDKPAMVWEDFRGTQRDVKWGELQSLSARAANVLRARGVILLSMSVLYGDEGIRHRVADSQAKLIVCSADEVERMPADLVEEVLVLDEELL